jgi:pimeloyl-ACP methyl ester carboxylesterase
MSASLKPANVAFRHSQVAVEGSSVHVVETGDPVGTPIVFVHGWPESWRSWQSVMELASQHVRAIALDLPGIGGSTGKATDGSKRQLARVVHGLLGVMDLQHVTIVGQDVGGMIAYAYMSAYSDLARVVIMDVVVPGLDPWDEVLRNPYLWHFAMHSIPDLPERLVHGRQAEYFDFFYDAISADSTKITMEARSAYVEAYSTDSALTAGFNWYRTFQQDAVENRQAPSHPMTTPLLYLRGEHEGGDIGAYIAGFRKAGVDQIEQGVVPGAGHFTQEEAPDLTWRLIADFVGV